LHEINITTDEPSKAFLNPKNNIQSICIDKNRIIFGTKAGDIYIIRMSEKGFTKLYEEKPKQIFSCYDHEVPKAVAFSYNLDRVYYLS
jgi:hypothetical protein